MPKITRIKANDTPQKKDTADELAITRKKLVAKDKKTEKNKKKLAREAEKNLDRKDSERKPFFLVRPFVYIGRYLRDSWRELRQVRWPNRKATWKMVFAVIVYTLLFVVIISLLDILFSFIFNLILGKG